MRVYDEAFAMWRGGRMCVRLCGIRRLFLMWGGRNMFVYVEASLDPPDVGRRTHVCRRKHPRNPPM